MHVTAQSTNLESVPVTNQQSSTLESHINSESGSNQNASCKSSIQKTTISSGNKQQERQHGNLDDEVSQLFCLFFSFLIKIKKTLK
jgi:hypothetical protein